MPSKPDVRVVAILHTSSFRGDHAADVARIFDVGPDESVKALCTRLFTQAQHMSEDFIELRPIERFPGYVDPDEKKETPDAR